MSPIVESALFIKKKHKRKERKSNRRRTIFLPRPVFLTGEFHKKKADNLCYFRFHLSLAPTIIYSLLQKKVDTLFCQFWGIVNAKKGLSMFLLTLKDFSKFDTKHRPYHYVYIIVKR